MYIVIFIISEDRDSQGGVYSAQLVWELSLGGLMLLFSNAVQVGFCLLG